jgi:hypothetical protein
VFDPFGGWGDRMIAAAAAGVQKYCCTDINIDLITGYTQIARMLREKTDTEIGFRFMPVEKYSVTEFISDYGKDVPDVIFTSPPFYNYEVYSDKISKKYTEWKETWFFPVMDRMWGMLKSDGYFAIHLSGISCKMSVDLQEFMAKRGREYIGAIACGYDQKFPLPVLVWKKDKKDPVLIMPPAKSIIR